MNLDGANYTMIMRDLDYYKAAYKRQLAITRNLELENAGCHVAIAYLKEQLVELAEDNRGLRETLDSWV